MYAYCGLRISDYGFYFIRIENQDLILDFSVSAFTFDINYTFNIYNFLINILIMAGYKKFEDLPCWQNARKFAAKADIAIESSRIRSNFKLRDQMLGSSGSVMDNIAEGFDRSSNAEFVRFLYYSKGSAAEFKSQLYRALDTGRIAEEEFEELKKMAEEMGNELGKFIKYLGNCKRD